MHFFKFIPLLVSYLTSDCLFNAYKIVINDRRGGGTTIDGCIDTKCNKILGGVIKSVNNFLDTRNGLKEGTFSLKHFCELNGTSTIFRFCRLVLACNYTRKHYNFYLIFLIRVGQIFAQKSVSYLSSFDHLLATFICLE